MIRFIKDKIKGFVFSLIKPPVKHIYNSYAQAGEDVIMKFLFDGRTIYTPSYLEIGVYLPDQHNNTYLFYQKGSRGVCVEADETLIPMIKKIRSEDKIINVGVGVSELKEADFYIFNEHALNTFNKEEAQYREMQGTYKIEEVKKVQLKNINSIISENFPSYPQILSLDIEGLDLLVLKTLNFKEYPIPVICVETCTYSENHIKPKDTAIQDFMLTQGYFVYADTYINTIFVNAEWFYSSN